MNRLKRNFNLKISKYPRSTTILDNKSTSTNQELTIPPILKSNNTCKSPWKATKTKTKALKSLNSNFRNQSKVSLTPTGKPKLKKHSSKAEFKPSPNNSAKFNNNSSNKLKPTTTWKNSTTIKSSKSLRKMSYFFRKSPSKITPNGKCKPQNYKMILIQKISKFNPWYIRLANLTPNITKKP